jgi:hypothetical protein
MSAVLGRLGRSDALGERHSLLSPSMRRFTSAALIAERSASRHGAGGP